MAQTGTVLKSGAKKFFEINLGTKKWVHDFKWRVEEQKKSVQFKISLSIFKNTVDRRQRPICVV